MNSKSILPLKTFLAYSLGCRTNQAEMEEISLQLMAQGFVPFDSKKFPLFHSPVLLLLNTCVVTQKAEKETRQKIRELRKKYPKSLLVVMGCAVTAKEKFNINLPKADLFVLNKNKAETVKTILNSLPNILINTHDRDKLSITYKNKYHDSGRKFIKIQDGCDKFCSFCLTCHLRGKPTSVPPEKIIEEINFWIEKGIKEIILSGINIGLYNFCHSDQTKCVEESLSLVNSQTKERDPSTSCLPAGRALGMTITNLVDKILKGTKVEKISFSSIYPEMLTDDFIKMIVNNPHVSQHFHLSLQSGSPSVLKRMERETNLISLLSVLKEIKKLNPFFTFRADIITGFPNETEEEFQETLDFIKKARISFAHIFTFSARKGTTAYKLINSGKWHEATEDIKKKRTREITSAIENIRNNEAKKMIGSSTNCLIVRKTPSSFRASEVSRGIPFFGKTMERDPSIPARLASESVAGRSVGMTKDQNGMTVYEGITENGWSIRISIKPACRQGRYQVLSIKYNELNIKGKILTVKITDFEKDYLVGEISSFPIN